MTRGITSGPSGGDSVIPCPGRVLPMRCEFCSSPLPVEEPENLALLGHVRQSGECGRQYGFLLENLRTSWTRSMSGG